MSKNDFQFRPGPCPGCGKPEGAFMGSSVWGHDLSCCGETCGLRVRDMLKAMREDGRYKFFEMMVLHAQDELSQLQRWYLEALRNSTLKTEQGKD